MPDTVQMPKTSLWANRRCLMICCIVSIANMQYGLDSAVVGGLQAMPGFLVVFGHPSSAGGYAIGGTFQQLISSLLTLGALFSSLVAGVFAHFLGRKAALWLACFLNAVACIIQIATVDKALFAWFVNIGSIIGTACTNALKGRMDKSSYQIPLGTLFIVPVFLGAGLFLVPESPRYLLQKGRTEEARKALEILRGGSVAQENLEFEWVEMVRGIEEEECVATTVGPFEMFRSTNRRRTLLCYATIASQSASGIWFVISYATYFLIVSGLTIDEAFEYSLMNTCIGFAGVNVGMFAMTHLFGRRSILILGAIVCSAAMLAMAVAATVDANSIAMRNCLIAFSALFQFGYNSCVGAASYPVATELVSTRLRSWTVGSATSLGYLLAWATGFFSPYFINPENLNWQAKYCYIWFASNLLCAIFFFLAIPETKGRTLEEIDELFSKQVSVRDFRTHHLTIVENAMATVHAKDATFSKGSVTTAEQMDKIER